GGHAVLVDAAPPLGGIHPRLERVEAQPVLVELLRAAHGVRVGLHGVGVAGRRSTVVVLGHAISYPPSPVRTRATAPAGPRSAPSSPGCADAVSPGDCAGSARATPCHC